MKKKEADPSIPRDLYGNPIHLSDLPEPGTRWIKNRKAIVVRLVEFGLIDVATVLQRYDMTMEEFASWQRGVETPKGIGLLVTKRKRTK